MNEKSDFSFYRLSYTMSTIQYIKLVLDFSHQLRCQTKLSRLYFFYRRGYMQTQDKSLNYANLKEILGKIATMHDH